jgi:hypothetical protein
MARHENKLIINYIGMNPMYKDGKVMCIAGRENAGPDDLGTIVAPMPAQDVNIDPSVPDIVLFSYANTKGGIVRLRVVVVKIESKAGLLSTCNFSVYVPFVDDLWISKTEDVTITYKDADGVSKPVRNPRGMVDVGDKLGFIDYETQVIATITEDALESAGDRDELTADALDLSEDLDDDNARGQAIVALDGKVEALYISADMQAAEFWPSQLLRLGFDEDGKLQFETKTFVGKNAQSIIPVLWNGKIWLLIPAIGGRQLYDGTTNGTESNICAVQADLEEWPEEADVKVTGDAYPPPGAESQPTPTDATAYNIMAVGAAMRCNTSKIFILTQVYNDNAKSAFWELYRTTVDTFLSIEDTPTLSDAVTAHKLDAIDEGMVEAADPTLPYSVYFWDIVYEQSHRNNEDEDRLWIALGSPLLVTKPGKYSSPNKPAGPFAMYYCIGGENVNSIDLPIETLHQAIRQVSLKRGMLGAVRVASTAVAGGSVSEQ